MEDFPRGRGAGSAGDDAPSFPRNNAGKVDKSLSLESKATPKRKRQPASADEGATAEVNATVKKPKTKTKSDISTNDEPSAIEPWRFKVRRSDTASFPACADCSRSQSLKPDSTHFLAIVREINDLELVVSLPNNLTGFVPITEISDIVSKAVEKATGAQAAESDKVASEVDSDSDDVSDLSSDVDGEVTLPSLEAMFRLGQIVRCVVTGIEDGSGKQSKGVAGEAAGDSKHRRRIEMSVSPGRTNSGVGPKALFEGLVSSFCEMMWRWVAYLLLLSTGFIRIGNEPRRSRLHAGPWNPQDHLLPSR